MDVFKAAPGFCPECGCILPPIASTGNVTCYNCRNEYPPEVYGDMKTEYRVHFNNYTPKNKGKTRKSAQMEEPDGPVVERKCPKCGNDKMSYATVQLRSADEGQTVFFTCLKCKYKESENS